MAAAGRVDPRLEPLPIPGCVRRLWEAFLQLAAARGSGMAAQPIAFADVEAWSRLYAVRLTPWELDTLLILDSVAIAAATRNTAKP